MNMPHLEFNVPAYMRSPTWRWEHALSIVNSPGPVLCPPVDNFLAYVCQYISLWSDPHVRPYEASLQFPHIHEAWCIWTSSNAGAGHRWWIEALLVAGESDAAIAMQLGIGHEFVVRAYRKTFYDIEHFGKDPDRIMAGALGHSLVCEPESDVDFTWKMSALRFGADGVRALLAFKRGVEMTGEQERYFIKMAKQRHVLNTFVATQSIRNFNKNQIVVLADHIHKQDLISTQQKVDIGNLADQDMIVAKEICQALSRETMAASQRRALDTNRSAVELAGNPHFQPTDDLFQRILPMSADGGADAPTATPPE